MVGLRGPKVSVAAGLLLVAAGEAMQFWGDSVDVPVGHVMRVPLLAGGFVTLAYCLLAWGSWLLLPLLASLAGERRHAAWAVRVVALANLAFAVGYALLFTQVMRAVAHGTYGVASNRGLEEASGAVMAVGFVAVSAGFWVAASALVRPRPEPAPAPA